MTSPDEPIRQLRFAAPPGACRLLLVRHGETIPVARETILPLLDGRSDPELDPVGVGQAGRIGVALAESGASAIYVTTLRRTHQTAAPLAAALGLEPRVEPDLVEVSMGDWEGGEFRRRVMAGDPVIVRMRTEQRWDVVPGGEDMEAFVGRVRAGVARIAAGHPDATVIVVSHGGTIGQILAEASGARPFAFAPDNGSVSEIVVAGDEWTVRRFNDVSHLSP